MDRTATMGSHHFIPADHLIDVASRIDRVFKKLESDLARQQESLDPRPRHGGFRPGDPCPDLFTEEEAIRYLRLDTIDIKNPGETLERYRKQGVLRGTQVSKRVFYLRPELDQFLKNVTNANPR
jgi:hypothetical protein